MMTIQQDRLDYYRTHGTLTDIGKYAEHIKNLPDTIPELVAIVQHLGIYDMLARDFYGVSLSEERMADIHLRSAGETLDTIFAISDKPLAVPRKPEDRIGCRCHAFTKLIVTLLRAKGIPARARCGFASYFNPGKYEDHWVCEYWDASDNRWVLLDAQIDDVWREKLGITWSLLDISRDQFLVAGDAWVRCQNDEANADDFGISFYEGMEGLWFIAGNLVRDVAALNKMEMLPWDVWGATAMPDTEITDGRYAFYSQLAGLSCQPDDTFDELRRLYATDDRLRVPKSVFNNLRQANEIVEIGANG
ncbi:MAG: transglutaminase-like domain-containing protein [Chloroflexota bacterium]